MANDRNLEVRVFPDPSDSGRYHWHIAIVGKWPIESSADFYASEDAARRAGEAALSLRAVSA
jgi:hypothetical protein